jgi:hypothetical protein
MTTFKSMHGKLRVLILCQSLLENCYIRSKWKRGLHRLQLQFTLCPLFYSQNLVTFNTRVCALISARALPSASFGISAV